MLRFPPRLISSVALILILSGLTARGQFFGGGGGKLANAAEVTHSPGGMTITPRGSIILSLHQFQKTVERVVEITPDGQVLSFPNAAISRGAEGAPFTLDAVLGEVVVGRGTAEQFVARHQNASTLSALRIWVAVSPSSGTWFSAWAISSSL